MNQTKIWEYYQNSGVSSFDGNYPRLNYISRKCIGLILNIGIGNAHLEKILYKKGIKVFSLDPDKEAIENLKMNNMVEDAKTGFSDSIPWDDEFFDVVVMTEVLEHLSEEQIDKTLGEVSRVLKKGGRFIGTVPAEEKLEEQMIVCPECGELFHRWGHQQSFTKDRINNYLIKKFINVELKRKYFIAWKILNLKGKTQALIKLLFNKMGFHGSNENIFFEAEK